MEITLAPEHEALVRRLVESGDYENGDAVIAEALRILADYDAELGMPKAAVKAEIQKGIDQLDRGEGKRWDLDEFLTRAAERRAKKSRG